MEERIKQLEENVKQLVTNQELLVEAIRRTIVDTNEAFKQLINKLVECNVIALKDEGRYDEMLKLFNTDEPSTEHQADDR